MIGSVDPGVLFSCLHEFKGHGRQVRLCLSGPGLACSVVFFSVTLHKVILMVSSERMDLSIWYRI